MSDAAILKILSGPHLGAEAPIGAGSYTIGRNPNCAIVLTDQLIAQRHLQLERQTSGEVFVQPLEGSVFLEGEALASGKRHRVEPFQVLTFGTTHGAWGATDASWPTINLPTLRHLGVQTEKDPHAQADTSAGDADTQDADAAHAKSESESESDGEPHGPTYAMRFRTWLGACFSGFSLAHFRLQQSTLTAFSLASLCLVFLGLQIYGLWPKVAQAYPVKEFVSRSNLAMGGLVRNLSGNPAPETDTVPYETKLHNILQDLPFRDLLSVQAPDRVDGIVSISGYLKTESQREALLSALRHAKLLPPLSIWVEDNIREDVQLTLQARGENLKVQMQEPGTFLLVGTPREAPEELEELLLGETPGLSRVVFQQPASDPNTEATAPQTAQKDFTLDIRSVSLGRIPYIILSNGNRYMEGGRLDNNLVLKEILNDRLILSARAGEFSYHFANP